VRLDARQLREALEASCDFWPEIPGVLERLSVPGVQARMTPVSSPATNLVSRARIDLGDADRTIARLRDVYTARGLAFGWLVSPSSTPEDLGERLGRAGFERLDEVVGMGLADLHGDPVPSTAQVRIERAGPAHRQLVFDTIVGTSGEADAEATYFAELQWRACELGRLDIYFAFLPGEQRPAAFGSMSLLDEHRVVYLRGAGTAERHRGRGLYTALTAARLRDARARGAVGAIVQARRQTSGRLLSKWGFVEVGTLVHYGYEPAASR
jgi:GNAT superfamily N-acetyltransferase